MGKKFYIYYFAPVRLYFEEWETEGVRTGQGQAFPLVTEPDWHLSLRQQLHSWSSKVSWWAAGALTALWTSQSPQSWAAISSQCTRHLAVFSPHSVLFYIIHHTPCFYPNASTSKITFSVFLQLLKWTGFLPYYFISLLYFCILV